MNARYKTHAGIKLTAPSRRAVVAVLAGGTGGAKLAAGLAEHDDVSVIANTGDDLEIYGVHVSPDPDLVTWWLAGIIDERGWGIAGDTFEAMKREDDPWFQLGDRDLELCRLRTEALADGARLTEAHAKVVEAVGVKHRVLPMSDEPVRTHVRTPKGLRPFQEFMIVDRWAGPDRGGRAATGSTTRAPRRRWPRRSRPPTRS